MAKKQTKQETRTVRVLSIRQPHIGQILHSDKFVENRTWSTTHRGPLYLHASRWEPGEPRESPGDGIVGAIIGRVTLAACVPVEDLDTIKDALFAGLKRRTKPKPVPDHLQPLLDLAISEEWSAVSFNRHAHGPVCWLLTDRKILKKTIPMKGRLNVWTTEIPLT